MAKRNGEEKIYKSRNLQKLYSTQFLKVLIEISFVVPAGKIRH